MLFCLFTLFVFSIKFVQDVFWKKARASKTDGHPPMPEAYNTFTRVYRSDNSCRSSVPYLPGVLHHIVFQACSWTYDYNNIIMYYIYCSEFVREGQGGILGNSASTFSKVFSTNTHDKVQIKLSNPTFSPLTGLDTGIVDLPPFFS